MSLPASRRGFLRDLVGLPLIGGGLTLIGQPSAVAEPVSRCLLDSYDAWLFYERRYLRFERYGNGPGTDLGCDGRFVILDTVTNRPFDYVQVANPGGRFHASADPAAACQPSARAALVLSAAGCDWREGTAWL